jgi:serine carboxypeptidase 1
MRGRSLAGASFWFRTRKGYSGYLGSKAVARPGGFSGLMNTVIKDKLGIIPQNVR